MTQKMLPTVWSSLLEQVKPYGETDYGAVLSTAADLLGFQSAQIEDSGRMVARVGAVGELVGAHEVQLGHSGSVLRVVWNENPSDEAIAGLNSFAGVLQLGLLAKDRRLAEGSTPMMSPTGAKDRLTNTIDRDAFTDYLTIEFGAGPTNATVMVLGIDGMSVVNDTMGHTVGDVVVAEVADRLRQTLRACDIISRLGGDVFGVYCPNMATETAQNLAGRLQAAIARPVKVQTNELRVTASVGVAARAKGEKAADTLSNGDTALQAAKASGAGELVVYDGAIRLRTEDRRMLATELVDALDQNQLSTAMEPIVHLPGGEIVGVEAHVVWEHPTRGEIDRSEFMDLAELIGRVGDVERAVVDYALIQQDGKKAMRTGINISGSTLRDPVAIDWMAERLASVPNSVIIEVTESAVSTAGAIGARNLDTLRDAGASIVLDDFGLSFASLRSLHSFHFDGVKLHTSLLSEFDRQEATSIVRSVYASAQSLGFDVVHCGVQTDDELRMLMALEQQISDDAGLYAQGAAVRARVEAATSA